MLTVIFTGLMASTGTLGTLAIQGMKSVTEAQVNKNISCKAKNQILENEHKKCLKKQKEQEALGDMEVVTCDPPKLNKCDNK